MLPHFPFWLEMRAIMQMFEYAGHTLTWEIHSPGEHTFIFLHGLYGARAMWPATIEGLRDLGRCVTLDLPGHYPAQVPSDYARLSQEFLIEIELEAIKHICGDGPVTIIGHSTGGLVALGVAARLSQQVRRVICIDGVVWGPLIGIIGTCQWMLRRRLSPLCRLLWWVSQRSSWLMFQAARSYVHDFRRFARNPTALRICRDWYPDYRRQSPANWAILLRMLESCDMRPLLRGVATPVLAITGANDPVVPPEQAHWLDNHLPNATLRVFQNTGHAPQIEQPDEWKGIVREWLARHPVQTDALVTG
jgi:pimeloyl-ACP methyl ester carboxylesterase